MTDRDRLADIKRFAPPRARRAPSVEQLAAAGAPAGDRDDGREVAERIAAEWRVDADAKRANERANERAAAFEQARSLIDDAEARSGVAVMVVAVDPESWEPGPGGGKVWAKSAGWAPDREAGEWLQDAGRSVCAGYDPAESTARWATYRAETARARAEREAHEAAERPHACRIGPLIVGIGHCKWRGRTVAARTRHERAHFRQLESTVSAWKAMGDGRWRATSRQAVETASAEQVAEHERVVAIIRRRWEAAVNEEQAR